MSLIAVRALTKSFGGTTILSDVTFQVSPQDRIGIVGENGSGKTTLFRMLLGQEEPDTGEVSRSRSSSFGYLEQHYKADEDRTVLEEAMQAFAEVARLEAELERLEHAMATETDPAALEKLMDRHARSSEAHEKAGGYVLRHRAEEMLIGLGLDEAMFSRTMSTLSGGETSRVSLAKLLLENPDVLLLDEPTNHLDIDGCEWLEDYLSRFSGTFLVISHDRWFLDRVTNRILEVEDGTVRSWNGNFSHFEHQKAEERKAAERAFILQQDFIKKEREFIRKHIGSQRSREAKGRLKRLERLELLLAPGSGPTEMHLRIEPRRRLGNDVIEAEAVSMAYGEKQLYSELSFNIEAGERFGIIGPNGTGKSTLLKILLGRERPTSGKVKVGSTVDIGYYDQRHVGLDLETTPFATIAGTDVQKTELEVRSYLARFLFFDEQLEQPIRSLSGGERGRLLLSKLLLERPNVLILDEPTNHLDIWSREALEEALDAFKGTLLVVSHDRYFLDKLCTRVLFLDGGKSRIHAGNYTYAHAARKRARAAELERIQIEKEERSKQQKKVVAATPQKKAKGPRPLEKIEGEIIQNEAKKQELLGRLGEPEVFLDPEKLKATKAEIEAVDQTLALLEKEWEQWM